MFSVELQTDLSAGGVGKHRGFRGFPLFYFIFIFQPPPATRVPSFCFYRE